MLRRRRRRRRLEEEPIETPGEEGDEESEPLCGAGRGGALARAARAILRGVHRERGAWSPAATAATPPPPATPSPRRSSTSSTSSSRRRGRGRGRDRTPRVPVFRWRRRDRTSESTRAQPGTLRHPEWGAIEVRVDGGLGPALLDGGKSSQQPSALSLEWRRWKRQASKTLSLGQALGHHHHHHLHDHRHELLYGATFAGLNRSLKVQNCR